MGLVEAVVRIDLVAADVLRGRRTTTRTIIQHFYQVAVHSAHVRTLIGRIVRNFLEDDKLKQY